MFDATSVSFGEELSTARAADVKTDASSEALLQELQMDLEEKMTAMNNLASRLASKIDNVLHCELINIPKNIRHMKMREFCLKYGGDIREVQEQTLKLNMPPPPPPVAAPQPTPKPLRTAPNKRGVAQPAARDTPSRRGPQGAATPLIGAGGRTTRHRLKDSSSITTPGPNMGRVSSVAPPITPRVGMTPRNARQTDLVFSQNGSPINVPDTVRAKVGGKRSHAEIVVSLGDGTEVNLAEPEVSEQLLDDATRDEAVQKLRDLQSQLAAHLAALENKADLPEL